MDSALAPQPGQRQAMLGAGTTGTAAGAVVEDDCLLRSVAQAQLRHWQRQAPQLARADQGSAQAGTLGDKGQLTASRVWVGQSWGATQGPMGPYPAVASRSLCLLQPQTEPLPPLRL